jgi:hypothetical protein
MAQEAAKVGVRRENHGAVTLLGELIGERLAERGVQRDALEWDAWRRDDGGWEVRLTYRAGGKERSALWVYDAQRRTVAPDDDEARWLLEDPAAAVVTPLRPVPTPEPEEATEPEAAAEPEARREAPPARSTTPARRAVEPPQPKRKKSERATVPSWDEILFGSKKPD